MSQLYQLRSVPLLVLSGACCFPGNKIVIGIREPCPDLAWQFTEKCNNVINDDRNIRFYPVDRIYTKFNQLPDDKSQGADLVWKICKNCTIASIAALTTCDADSSKLDPHSWIPEIT